MSAILAVLLVEILVLLGLGIPAVSVRWRWAKWVGRLSPYLRRFERPRRFGFRSWAARSFALTSPTAGVRERLSALPETTLEELLSREGDSSGLLTAAGVLGRKVFPTGIQVEWVDDETADIRARMYADWPENLEDSVKLPLKQRQMLAEHALLYVRADDGDSTRVEYEMEVPVWVYIMSGALVLLAFWSAWGASNLARVLTPVDLLGAVNPWLWPNTVAFGTALAWVITRIVPVLRLQSISLFDNVIAGLGEITGAGIAQR